MMDSTPSIYDLECADLRGRPVPMGDFRDRPILIVNTASLCGFSGQLRGLESVWKNNKDKGLIVLGVPSGDFGRQELGSNTEIVSMCVAKFGITFPLLAKTHVRGTKADPLFRWIVRQGGFWARPHWNFYKYLVGREGHLQNWFSSFTPPEAPRFARAVAKLIAA